MSSEVQLDICICSEIKGKDKIYSISSIQVPNVVTQGKTVEEATARLKEALKLYFEDMPEQKEQIVLSCKREAPIFSRIFL